ncbi:MAG: Sapep family Mn(2+)-dependent dipeptidase [Clostridia bacterium]|nr:Sapep family Mn(2+)-dependent dipeptidase [Clostridia bacterium]
MISKERYARILDYIKAHEDDIIRDLSCLCSMPSVTSESQDENEPFGHECALCLEKAAELFRQNGFDADVYAKSGYALACGANLGSKKTIGIYAHTDVVPVNETEWTVTKPFEPKVIGNCIVARGVSDNKGAVIASLYIMKALRELGIGTNSKFQIFLGSNEESGMRDVKAFAKEQKLPDVNIVPDAGYPAAIGQKGIYRFDIRAKKPFEDIVNISGGTAYNILLDKVSAKLKRNDALFEELRKKANDEITVEDGSFITVTAVGVSAHAATAWQGVNAFWILTKFLLGIESLSKNDKETLKFVEESLSDVYCNPWGIASESEFFGETTGANGIVRTVNGCLEYTFDVRHNDNIRGEALENAVRSYFEGAGFEYRKYSHSDCMKRDENSMPIKTFMDGYRALTGKEDAKPYVMGGGTYANHLDGGFAIGVGYRAYEKNVELLDGHGGAHQADEICCIPNLMEGIALMAELLLEIDDNLI